MNRDNKDRPLLPQIGSFYARLFTNSWSVFVFVEVLVVGVAAMTFTLLMSVFGLAPAIVTTIIILIVIESAIGYLLLRYVLEPTDLMARYLMYVRGEPLPGPLPDRNDPRFIKSGLNLLLETILSGIARKKDEPTPSDTQQPLQDLLAALPIGFIAMDSNHRVIAANSLAPIYTAPDGKRQIQLDFTDTNDSLDAWLKQVVGNEIEAEKIWPHIQNVAPDQPDRRIFDVIAHYRQDSLDSIAIVIVTIDRTAEYWGEEDNADFVALAAHELRGPITVIRGYLDILDQQLGTTRTKDQQDLLDRLNVSAKRLSSYVNNVLNASRYDHKHLKLHLSETPVSDIIGDVRDDMELRARTQNRTLVWQIPDQLPTVAVDRSSISEVLCNLIDNAIKYSHDGGQVEISATPRDDFVAISIRDHGIGMPAVVTNNLFSKFYRSHRSRNAVSGTGIGLFISRGIVESHGGHIGAESTEGKGSTFTFTLPIFSTVADKLAMSSSDNNNLIRDGGSWIRNHSRIQG
ncbi:HAMP domain-containing histidine kinase [Candidatus Saccharibacteria bacterium]|nr:HAMP domain-containing histidine kinase [Candidatus Saccharibacteria bacterium]